jgi:hypothetical protein
MIQAVKDSFYIALRDRLALRNPDRKVTIGSEERPAIVVAENELVASASPLLECFHLKWAKLKPVTDDQSAPLYQLSCEISYATEGSDPLNAQDRGRILAAMDAELLDICRPGRTELEDLGPDEDEDGGSAAPFATGATLFWALPQLAEQKADGRRLSRVTTVELFTTVERMA